MVRFLLLIVLSAVYFSTKIHAAAVYDAARDRHIPIAISAPEHAETCTFQAQCPMVFFSAGYGVSHSDYQFLTARLNKLGYLVVAIGHELPLDPPLSKQGNLFETRQENWQRGAQTLMFLQQHFATTSPEYDANNLVLIGHSNGGDIASWLANTRPELVSAVITLDHRRVPLPRNYDIRVLSIRATDYPADQGVLPTSQERIDFGMCVVKIANAKHNDMSDYGPDWLKHAINQHLQNFLVGRDCAE